MASSHRPPGPERHDTCACGRNPRHRAVNLEANVRASSLRSVWNCTAALLLVLRICQHRLRIGCSHRFDRDSGWRHGLIDGWCAAHQARLYAPAYDRPGHTQETRLAEPADQVEAIHVRSEEHTY